jgi:hypothetical protein
LFDVAIGFGFFVFFSSVDTSPFLVTILTVLSFLSDSSYERGKRIVRLAFSSAYSTSERTFSYVTRNGNDRLKAPI